jgi:hypothetical protein
VALGVVTAIALASVAGCGASDPRTAVLEDRALYSVALTSWADRGDGTLVASVRISGPVHSKLRELTFEVQGRDAQNEIVLSEWVTVDLSEMVRGTPLEQSLILETYGLPLEGLAIDLHPNPDPEALTELEELREVG